MRNDRWVINIAYLEYVAIKYFEKKLIAININLCQGNTSEA